LAYCSRDRRTISTVRSVPALTRFRCALTRSRCAAIRSSSQCRRGSSGMGLSPIACRFHTGGRKPGDASHSVMCEPVSARRALRTGWSRSAPSGRSLASSVGVLLLRQGRFKRFGLSETATFHDTTSCLRILHVGFGRLCYYAANALRFLADTTASGTARTVLNFGQTTRLCACDMAAS
jgi:hypothetical protein